jgi:quinol monooxygenase YgiN
VFIQTITVTTSHERELVHHLAEWHSAQCGVAPGYRGARLLSDRDRPDRFVIEATFGSEEEAALNNDRPETVEWSSALRGLATSEPRFADHCIVLDTLPRI